MNLPTREEINVHDSPDERSACERFLGKTLPQAEALFRENALLVQEDLMFMGPRAFCYYVQAAIGYIESDDSSGDADMINCFAGILEHRREQGAGDLSSVAPRLASVCAHIVADYDRFEVAPEVYGDLRPRFRALERAFLR